MITKILALVLCATLSILVAADVETKPKDTFKPVPADLALDIAKSQAKLQAIERQRESATAELWERIRKTEEFRRAERASEEEQAKLNSLLGKARASSGAPVTCWLDLDQNWVQAAPGGSGIVPCAPPAKPEVKK